MQKILFCASTTSHIRNFHLPYIKALQECGYEVWVAANKKEDIPHTHQVESFPFSKSFLNIRNISCIFKLRKFLLIERFDKISTHTTLASTIIRAAVLLMPKNMRPRVFYISHGFLFHETDGLKKWIYLLPEKICTPVTNILMVMNQEDLEIAQKHHLYKEQLHFINGIGFDSSKFKPLSLEVRVNERKALGYSDKSYLFVYAAEFSKRKNQEFLIRAFAKAAPKIPHAHLLLAGTGALLEKCKLQAKELNIENQILFLGYVTEMDKLYPLCDAAVSSSKIEGLPFNILEAMSCGLPILISDTKGHRDLVKSKKEFLFQTEQELSEKMIEYVLKREQQDDWIIEKERYEMKVIKKDIISIYNK